MFRTMKLLVLGLMAVMANSQVTVDPEILSVIFDKPLLPDPVPDSTTDDKVTINPAILSLIFDKPLKPLPSDPGTDSTTDNKVTIDPAILSLIFDKPLKPLPPDPGTDSTTDNKVMIDPEILSIIFDKPLPPEAGSASTTDNKVMIDPEILSIIFDKPLPPEPGSASTIDDEILHSTTSATTALVEREQENQDCQCVPFYLCNSKNVGADVNNANVTGYGILDVKFGEDEKRSCQESVEICCTIPVDPAKPKPRPDPAKVSGCGYRNPKGVGATFTHAQTQFGEFPWVVALLDKNQLYLGVGVLIHPEVVMTGAHIAFKYSPDSLKIRAGEWDTQTLNEIYDFQERAVKEIYIHEDYHNKNLRNDIALLRLDTPLEFSEHINAICMPEQEEIFDDHTNCIANGWGKDIFGLKGRFAVILKKVELSIVPYSRCNSLLKRTRLGSRFKLHDSFLCAGGTGEDTCEGDGGAPLACPIGNNRYKLTGLVAWGIGCGQKDVPGVYTNVPAFRNWVDTKMRDWGLSSKAYKIS